MIKQGLISGILVLAAAGGIIYSSLGSRDTISSKDGGYISGKGIGSNVVQDLAYGRWRIAIANQSCPEPPNLGEQPSPAYNYLTNHCKHWQTHGNWCACATKDEDLLIGEVDESDLPNQIFRKMVVCEHGISGHPEQLVREVIYAKLTDNVPPGWRCIVVANRIIWQLSYRPVRSKLLEKLQEKCCSACPESCWVTEGEWGQCPYCLLDNDCDRYCL